ncbi:hypothetical protein GALMADRAFT_224958 [Galerina marginata CBS 339.88]|uniref:Uncharacterized protein n=1 Tax=Galerina marginata (strain CBS 339.88) TaxID=685588 RepID=A0A067TFF3_GALM3|nr:hypothetical protein GALMADRAFT_224958 [Galerina marginata CBS 339.88]
MLKKNAKPYGAMNLLSFNMWHRVTDPRPCEACYSKMLARIEASRKKVWDRLPAYFGLPAWNELRDD